LTLMREKKGQTQQSDFALPILSLAAQLRHPSLLLALKLVLWLGSCLAHSL
jgi:hypothetical protein